MNSGSCGIRQLGHDVVRPDFDLAVAIELVRHLPPILAVVEGRGIGHVVGAVHLGLDGEQVLGIADVTLQIRRHLAAVLEQAGQHLPIGLDDRIVGVEDVERDRAVIGVDDRLDRVAQVVAAAGATAANPDRPRCRDSWPSWCSRR